VSVSDKNFDINSITVTPDPSVVASGADDGVIRLWDKRVVSSHTKPVGGFIGHHQGIVSMDYCPGSTLICSSSKDQTIKLWDMRLCSSSEDILTTKLKTLTFDYRQGFSY
jgi:WD repeat-containing protein 23